MFGSILKPSAVAVGIAALALASASVATAKDTRPAAATTQAPPAEVATLIARSRRSNPRTLATTYYINIPTIESHAACNYNDPYGGQAFGNSRNVIVWLPLLNQVPGFGGPQRAYWRAQVQAVDSYNRPIPSTTAWTRAAYTGFAFLQPWFDLQTNAFLGQGGHVPTLFPMYSNNHFTVQDEYWFFMKGIAIPVEVAAVSWSPVAGAS
jgi:hypothetical protein